MKEIIKKIPVIGDIAVRLKRKISSAPKGGFTNSEVYWIERYEQGGNSGAGSYNKLASFKAEIINNFISKKKIQTVIELGSGDGNQLKYMDYPSYIGFDISTYVLEQCRIMYEGDDSKQFLHTDELPGHKAEVTLSLDVIYHLIEDEVYETYMHQLFDASNEYVIIYSSNVEEPALNHVKSRKFTDWIDKNKPHFKLIEHIPNKYPYVNGDQINTSISDFYIYQCQN